jgi:hypothetical protein
VQRYYFIITLARHREGEDDNLWIFNNSVLLGGSQEEGEERRGSPEDRSPEDRSPEDRSPEDRSPEVQSLQ